MFLKVMKYYFQGSQLPTLTAGDIDILMTTFSQQFFTCIQQYFK